MWCVLEEQKRMNRVAVSVTPIESPLAVLSQYILYILIMYILTYIKKYINLHILETQLSPLLTDA